MKKNKPEKGKMRKMSRSQEDIYFKEVCSQITDIYKGKLRRAHLKLTGSKTFYDTLFILP